MKIAIIGAGWYGCHIALELKKEGHDVELFEKSSTIFSGISGSYGIRLHRGPHYPRSDKTREFCQNAYDEFIQLYPELIVKHSFSHYALGIKDALGYASKVDKTRFSKVCKETKNCEEVTIASTPYQSLQTVFNLDEPSIALGQRLRRFFERRLREAGINIHINCSINSIQSNSDDVLIEDHQKNRYLFDYVVNATSFKEHTLNLSNSRLPIDLKISYQVCASLIYRDTAPGNKPFSWIVMDGWFPCVMPVVQSDQHDGQYILTHGCYTIMATCESVEEAQNTLDSYTDEYMNQKSRIPAEKDMQRYWPDFFERFQYIGWKGAVIAKPKTKSEFRAAITFMEERVIYIVPGKVSNVINAADETKQLLTQKNCINHYGVEYVKNGVLDTSKKEIEKHPEPGEQSTVNLNTNNSAFPNNYKHQFFTPTTKKSAQDNIGAAKRL